MALNLTEEQRTELLERLNKAIPYDEDDPILDEFDAPLDDDRWSAMMAKRFLEQDDREKAANKD